MVVRNCFDELSSCRPEPGARSPDPKTTGILLSINTSDGGVPKLPRHQARITADGVEGDGQRDRRLHGGPDRAVCLYSFDRIRALRGRGASDLGGIDAAKTSPSWVWTGTA